MRKLFVLAVSIMCLSAVLASVRTVAIDKVNRDADSNIVSFDLAFGVAGDNEVDSLYLAYGTSNGGDDLANWDHADLVRRVVADEAACTIPAPAGIGTDYSHVRVFLVSGFQPPYDTRLDTVKSASGYIDTEWVPNQDTFVWADVEVTDWSEYWFGCWGNDYSHKAFAFRGNGSDNYYNGVGNGFRGNQKYLRCKGRHILTLNEPLPSGERGVSITPVDPAMAAYATNWTYAASTFSAEVTMYLFGFHAVTAFQTANAVTIRRFKMYDAGVLVRDFVPCVKDNTAMMYDALNNKLYEFHGGTRTLGTEIVAADDDIVAVSTGGQSATETLAYVKHAVTATVVPAQAGRVIAGATQAIDDGSVPQPITVMPVNGEVTFLGWRLAGTQEILSTDFTYQLGAISGPVAVEAVFDAPEPSYEFVVRYDSAAADGGDGFSWAKAFNKMDDAIAIAQTFGGGEVWVKCGTHVLAKGFSLKNTVTIRGGFEGVDGKYATRSAEREARDFTAYESVFSGGGKIDKLIDQSTTADETAVVDGITFTKASNYSVYVTGNAADYTSPVFSNCTFRGKSAFWMNSRYSQATFANCTFKAMEGGSYGRVFFESNGGGVVRLTDCVVDSVTNSGYGVFNFAGGNSAVFERCRFTRCVSTGGTSPAIIAGRGGIADFYDCQFVGNSTAIGCPLTRFRTMVGCVVASNTVTRTGTSTDQIGLLHMTGSTCYRTSIYDNKVVVDEPTVTAGTIWADIFSFAAGPSKAVIVDCTVARNACEVTLGEGATAQSAVIGYSGNQFGGIVNCTFVDNRMLTADVVDRGFAKQAVPLVNDIFWSSDADFAPVKAVVAGNKGFMVKNCVIRNFDAALANATTAENVSGIDPQFARKPKADALGRRAYPVYKDGSASKKGLSVTVGANLGFAIDGTDSDWSGAAPSEPVELITDIHGQPWAAGVLNIGASQDYLPPGLMLLLR